MEQSYYSYDIKYLDYSTLSNIVCMALPLQADSNLYNKHKVHIHRDQISLDKQTLL